MALLPSQAHLRPAEATRPGLLEAYKRGLQLLNQCLEPALQSPYLVVLFFDLF